MAIKRKINRFILRHRLLILLASILMLMIFFPFLFRHFSDYVLLLELFFIFLLLGGINVVSRNKKIVTVSVLIAFMAVVVIAFDYVLESRNLLILGLGLEILFLSITTFTVISHVLSYKKITEDKIYGAICAYLLIGIIWAMIYTTIEIAFPNSFHFAYGISTSSESYSTHRFYFSQFIYYSYVTLSTLGYGDIVPITQEARVLSSLEAVIGQLYVAVLIARLVGLHITHTYSNKR
jgi:voltage-gated potassium channel Kch